MVIRTHINFLATKMLLHQETAVLFDLGMCQQGAEGYHIPQYKWIFKEIGYTAGALLWIGKLDQS